MREGSALPTLNEARIKRLFVEMRVLFGVLFIGVIFGFYQTDEVTSDQDDLVDTAQLAAAGNCARANINSAIIKGSFSRPEPGSTPSEQRNRELIAAHLYPIVDCRQSLLAGRGIPIDPGEVQKYVATVFMGRAPVIKDGKVGGSRGTILEGINTDPLRGRE